MSAIIVSGLRGNARLAAEKLLRLHPSAVLTSGKRDLVGQCRAMARNIVRSKDRRWIERTYRTSTASVIAQTWVSANPNAKTADEICAGLLRSLSSLPVASLRGLSLHLSGDAFDVDPKSPPEVVATMRALVVEFGGKMLEKEGDLVIYHLQF